MKVGPDRLNNRRHSSLHVLERNQFRKSTAPFFGFAPAETDALLTCLSGPITCIEEGYSGFPPSCTATYSQYDACHTKNPGDGCNAGYSSTDLDTTCSMTLNCSGQEATVTCDGVDCTCAGGSTNKAKFAQAKTCKRDPIAVFAVKCGVK